MIFIEIWLPLRILIYVSRWLSHLEETGRHDSSLSTFRFAQQARTDRGIRLQFIHPDVTDRHVLRSVLKS